MVIPRPIAVVGNILRTRPDVIERGKYARCVVPVWSKLVHWMVLVVVPGSFLVPAVIISTLLPSAAPRPGWCSGLRLPQNVPEPLRGCVASTLLVR